MLSIDANNFPDMSAEFIALDVLGDQIRGLAPGDLRATENGESVDPTSIFISCPPAAVPIPIHAVLVADKSGSMGAQTSPGVSRFAVLKRGASAFVHTVRFIGNTEVAVTSFSDLPDINQDFTRSVGLLETAISLISPGDGTDYMPALMDRSLGAIPLLAGKANTGERRVIVFLTDGLPQNAPDVEAIVAAANAANISIFTITIGLPMTADLRHIAERTGGWWYGDVNNEDQMRAVYTSIALRSQGIDPCRITWRSEPGCGQNSALRTFMLGVPRHNVQASSVYHAPARAVISMEMTPDYLWFGPVAPPAKAQRGFTITARGNAMTVTGAELPAGTPFAIVDWGGTPPPFSLDAGQSRTITVEFRPTDSSVAATTLHLSGTPCDLPELAISGGAKSPLSNATIRLLSPSGGEGFNGCDSIPIRWAGVAPTDPVTLEYSTDGGATWLPIAKDVTGLARMWRAPVPGKNYKVRVSAKNSTDPAMVGTAAGGGGDVMEGIPALQTELSSPAAIALDGDLLYIAEAGAHRVRRVDLRSGLIRTIAGSGAVGYAGDGGQATDARLANPAGIAIAGQLLYIADYGNNRVRRVDMATGIITTVAGTGGSGVAGDGGKATDAELFHPACLTIGRNVLFVSDEGNNRVRAVDTKTNLISTVAGGGWLTGGDGSPATNVILAKPAGLAFVADPAGRNDSLFIAEENGHRVRVVEMKSRVISSMAGTGIAGIDGDGKDGRDTRLTRPRGVMAFGNVLYFSEAGSNRVRMLNRSTMRLTTLAGSGQTGFNGDGIPALTARMGPTLDGLAADFGRCFVSDVGNNRVRLVTISNAGSTDSSRASFTVSVGRIRIAISNRTADLGTTSIGATHDMVFPTTVCNAGDVAILVDSVRMLGPNADDFTIVSGVPGGVLSPGACFSLEIRFSPKATGARKARAVFFGRCGGTDTLMLEGIGQNPCGIAALDRVEMGSIAVGDVKDSVVRHSICNDGSGRMDGNVTIWPTSGSFSITSGAGAFSLAPGECHDVTVRFAPIMGGPIGAQLEYGVASGCGAARTVLVGHGAAGPRLITATPVMIAGGPCDAWPRDTVLTLANTGDARLVITEIALAANNEGFTIVSGTPSATLPLVIEPAATAPLHVRLSPVGFGAKTATLHIVSNDPAGPIDVQLQGNRDLIALQMVPSTIAFRGTSPMFPVDSPLVVTNIGTMPVTITSATIGGTNGANFTVPGGQLPLTIGPGDRAVLNVRALGPTTTLLSGTLTLLTTPACDPAGYVLDIVETGRVPLIATDDMTFASIRCPSTAFADTIVTIRNLGGAALTINGITLSGLNPSMFSITATTPMVIPPDGSLKLSVRFRPPAPGTFTAHLRIASNALNGTDTVHLTGTKLDVRAIARPASLDYGTIAPGAVSVLNARVINTGNAPINVSLTTSTAEFNVSIPQQAGVPPADSLDVPLRFSSTATGVHYDTLIIRDVDCGTALRIPLRGEIRRSIRTTISLPNDSAAPGSIAVIPLRVAIADRPAFDASGARAFSAVLRFDGRLLVPESVQPGAITSADFDRFTGMQTVTIAGSYGGHGDTLAVLRCMVPSGRHGSTSLGFAAFAWDVPEVAADTLPGLFSTGAGCGPGTQLTARIKALKVRPHPVSDHATAAFELEEEETVRVSVQDMLGRTVAAVEAMRFGPGEHAVPLALGAIPAGMYRLVIETPFGAASTPILLVR